MNYLQEFYQAIQDRRGTKAASTVLATFLTDVAGAVIPEHELKLEDYHLDSYKDHLSGAVLGSSCLAVLFKSNLTKSQLRYGGIPLAISVYLTGYALSTQYRSWKFVQDIINDPNTRLARSMKKAFDSANQARSI